jgi:predicted lipopolysaccharide heptosyltransferase III
MRILLVRLRQIGDVVFTTPAIRALRQRFPDAHLAYLVEPAAAAVVLYNPHLNDVIVAPRLRGLRGVVADLRLGRQLRSHGYDVVIDFHGGPRASLLTWLSRARVRIGYEIVARSWMYTRRVHRPRELRPRHSVENQWDLLESLGIERPDRTTFPVEMAVHPAAAARVGRRLTDAGVQPSDDVVVIHVSAGNPFRRWPLAHFAALAAALVDEDDRRRIVFTSGPSEHRAAATVIADARARLGSARADRVLSCGEFSLDELRALVERASLYIGGDSGPLHIAATSRVPVVGLYGPTLPVRSAPWRDPACADAAVDAGDLPCRPCDQRECAPGDFRCLTTIEPRHVLEAAARVTVRTRRDSATSPTPSR